MNKSNSIGINKWAGQTSLIKIWEHGTGDARMVGWERWDGALAIETNGDPIFGGDVAEEIHMLYSPSCGVGYVPNLTLAERRGFVDRILSGDRAAFGEAEDIGRSRTPRGIWPPGPVVTGARKAS